MSLGIALGASVVNMEAHTARGTRIGSSSREVPSPWPSPRRDYDESTTSPPYLSLSERNKSQVFTDSIGQRCNLPRGFPEKSSASGKRV